MFFQDIIGKYYSEKDISFYRTVRTNPPTDDDLLPPKFINKTPDEINELLIEYDEEDIEELTETEKKQEVGSYATSGFKSAEKCKSEAIRTYKGIKRKHPPEVAETYKQKRGPYVAKFHMRPNLGVMSDFDRKKGHANIIPRDNVRIEDIWDDSFPLEYIDYDNESDDNEK